MFDELKQCNICKNEYTTMHVEYKPGVLVYVCPSCMEKSRDNFVWLCLNCGKSYFRPKKLVIDQLERSGLGNASLLGEGIQLIQGIEICIECDPQGILEYVNCKEEELDTRICEN